jgi:outer membrane protein
MRSFRTLPLISAMALSFCGMAQSQSLLELYDAARGFDANYQSVQAQFEATRLKSAQAQSKLGPTGSLSVNVSKNNISYDPSKTLATNPSFTRFYGSNTATVVGSQPLYRPGDKAEVAQSSLQMQVVEEQLAAAEQDLMVRVSQAYFDVLASLDTLAFVQAQKAAVAEQLASAKRNFEVGTATITDTREAQAGFDLVTAQEIGATNDLQVKKLALDQVVGKMGTQPKTMLAKAEPSELVPAQVEDWVSLSSEKNPVLRQAAIGLKVTELETQKAKAALKPTVDMQLSHTFSNNTNASSSGAVPFGATSNLTTGALVLSWPFYTGNALDNRVRETLSLTQKAQADLDAATRNVAQNTRSAFFGVVSGVSQVKALQAAVESGKVALEANKLGYTVGVRINMNVLDAQSKLFDTRAKLAKARYDVLMGHLRLRQVSGTLQLQDLQGINNLLEP